MAHTFIIEKTAWHYRWLCFYNACLLGSFRRKGGDAQEQFERYYLRPGDFCQYWRMVMLWPGLRIGAHLTLYATALWFFLNTTKAGATTLGWIVVILLFIATFGIGCAVILHFVGKGGSKLASATGSSSILKTAYSSWKDKYCPDLSYGNGDNQ